MLEHAQYTKARTLQQCCDRLCSLGLEGADADLDWSILSLLTNLAYRPLDTPTPTLQAALASPPSCTEEEAEKIDGDGTPRKCGLSEDEHSGDRDWDSASDLSDWSDETDEKARAEAAQVEATNRNMVDVEAAEAASKATRGLPSSGPGSVGHAQGPAAAPQPTDVSSSSSSVWSQLAAGLASRRAIIAPLSEAKSGPGCISRALSGPRRSVCCSQHVGDTLWMSVG
jgi:hypothetical protein